jgi:hypothetical protein
VDHLGTADSALRFLMGGRGAAIAKREAPYISGSLPSRRLCSRVSCSCDLRKVTTVNMLKENYEPYFQSILEDTGLESEVTVYSTASASSVLMERSRYPRRPWFRSYSPARLIRHHKCFCLGPLVSYTTRGFLHGSTRPPYCFILAEPHIYPRMKKWHSLIPPRAHTITSFEDCNVASARFTVVPRYRTHAQNRGQ